jgi:hypothetical protein
MADLSLEIDNFLKLVDSSPTQIWIDKSLDWAAKQGFTKAFHLVGPDAKDAKDSLGGTLAEHAFLSRALTQAKDLDDIARTLRKTPVPAAGIVPGTSTAPTAYSPQRPGQMLQLMGPDPSAMTVTLVFGFDFWNLFVLKTFCSLGSIGTGFPKQNPKSLH